MELSYSADFFRRGDRFDLIIVADVLYDRANLRCSTSSSVAAAKRWWPTHGCATSSTRCIAPWHTRGVLTWPDLAEPAEFRHVSLYHAQRD